MSKDDRLAKKQREDQTLNRVLWWFGGAVVLEFFLLLLNRFYVNYDVGGIALAGWIFRFLRVFAWVCLAAAVGLGVWWAAVRKKGGKSFGPGAGALASAVLFVCALVAGMWKDLGVQILYVAVPIAAVLALIYYLYQREFFFVALQGGMTLFALWAFHGRLLWENTYAVYGIFAVEGVLTLAGVVLFILLQRGKGRLGKVRILHKRANYIPLYLAAGVTVLSLLATLLFGRTAAYIAIFAVAAWLFGAAVYYTVRLM